MFNLKNAIIDERLFKEVCEIVTDDIRRNNIHLNMLTYADYVSQKMFQTEMMIRKIDKEKSA